MRKNQKLMDVIIQKLKKNQVGVVMDLGPTSLVTDSKIDLEFGTSESIKLTRYKRLDSVAVHNNMVKNPRRFQRSLSVEEYCKRKIKQNLLRQDQMLLPTTVDDTPNHQTFGCRFPPLAILLISLIEIIFFVIDDRKYLVTRPTSSGSSHNDIGAINYWLRYDPHRRYEIWRFVSYMLVHVDTTHLVVNVVTQLIFGIALELLHGWWRTVLIYLAGVLLGVLGTSIEDPHIFLVGASGGVYALLAACLVTVIMNWRDLEYAVIYCFLLVLVSGTETVFSLLDYFDSRQDVVSYMAHLCGAIAGVLLGISILINYHETLFKKALRVFSGVVFAIVLIALICFHITSIDSLLLGRT